MTRDIVIVHKGQLILRSRPTGDSLHAVGWLSALAFQLLLLYPVKNVTKGP